MCHNEPLVKSLLHVKLYFSCITLIHNSTTEKYCIFSFVSLHSDSETINEDTGFPVSKMEPPLLIVYNIIWRVETVIDSFTMT